MRRLRESTKSAKTAMSDRTLKRVATEQGCMTRAAIAIGFIEGD